MDRKLAVALSSLIGGITLGNTAYAIGLGDIKLHSALNEPLRAEIKLVQVNDLNENQIIVDLASAEDFANAHVDRDYLLNSLRFRLDLDDPKNPKVVVTTQQPIREPFLNFLVSVQWPSGRLLREYTLLMDLPTYTQSRPEDGFEAPVAAEPRVSRHAKKAKVAAEPVLQPAQPIESAMAAPTHKVKKTKEATQETPPAKEPTPVAQPAEQPKQPEPVKEKPADTSASVGSYGPTRTNDTLWHIARGVRGKGSIQQKLMAIQRLNPEAFSKNNVNLLKTGKVLRLPSEEEIVSLGRAEAFSKMKEQEEAWKAGASLPPPTGAQVDATGRAQQPVAAAPATDGQLKLTTPTPATESANAAAQGKAGEQNAAAELKTLKNDLSVGMEELNRAQRENQDVTSRIKDIDTQKANADKLLQLQSNELAALQAKLAAEQQAQAKAAADAQAKAVADAQAKAAQPVAVTTPQPATAAVQPAQQQPAPAASATTTSAAQPQPAAVKKPQTPVVHKPVVQQPPVASEPSLHDQLMGNPAIAGAVAVVLMLLGLVGYRKRATRQNAADAVDEDFDADNFSLASREEEEAAAEWHEPAAEIDHNDVIEAATEVAPVADTKVAAPEPVKAESGDVLGEADIYISFGNFDKGEALLNSAIASEPTRSDYRLKLLELYKETGKLAAFDEAYKALIELDDDAAIANAGTLRAAIPGAAATPFAFGVTSAAEAAGISDEPEFDLDFDFDAHEPAPVVAESAAAPLLDDSELTITPQRAEAEAFDVSLDLDAEDVIEQQPAPLAPPALVEEEEDDIVAGDAGFDLDFDLDLEPAVVEPEPEFDLSDVGLDEPAPAQQLDSESAAMLGAVTADAGDIDEELGFLSDADEAATKLDLARAYIDMGDKDGARDILAEVLDEGRDDQKREAQALLDSIS